MITISLAVLLHWAWVHFGLSGTGVYYFFWSGIGSDLGEYVIVGTLITGTYHVIRSNNCEVHRCWRIGKHKTAAGHKVCRTHHPDDKLTHQDVLDSHYAVKLGSDGKN